jgi:hypothetical protein
MVGEHGGKRQGRRFGRKVKREKEYTLGKELKGRGP